jgi:cobalt/nickel transport system ATP-binding protein
VVGGAETLTPLALEIRQLDFSYPGGPQVLQALSLAVPPGERVAVLGPNGAGKSTLLWHLNGLLPETPTTEPTVFVNGVAVLKANFGAVRRQVGFLFQNPDDQLFCPTVGEDVAFGLQQSKSPAGDTAMRVAGALRAVDLEGFEDRPPSALSLGEKKRACIAGLLASEPSILALDEPTSSLDPRSRRGVVNLLAKLPQTMVVATHDLALAKELCQRAIILDEGVIRADGESDAVLNDRALLERHGLYA